MKYTEEFVYVLKERNIKPKYAYKIIKQNIQNIFPDKKVYIVSIDSTNVSAYVDGKYEEIPLNKAYPTLFR
jgi:hypothetical protein